MSAPAKITAPNPVGVIPRARLFRLLDEHKHRPIAWIAGPPGAGKTSLATSYLSRCKKEYLWYHLDATDNDPANFFYYLSAADQTRGPRGRRPLPLLSPEYAHDTPTFARRFFEQLVERCAPGSLIVLDNFHEIEHSEAMRDALHECFFALSHRVRLLVLSRTLPPAHLARLQANGQIVTIEWDALHLTPDESVRIARSHSPRGLSRRQIEDLHYLVDGWPAGLVMMVSGIKAHQHDGGAPEPITRDNVFDYFANEVFDRATPELRDLLLKTALVPRCTAAMAAEVTGVPAAGSMLHALARTGYFTVAHGRVEPSFDYHPLFRAFLAARAHTTLTTAEVSRVRRRAADVFEKAGQIEAAVELLQQTETWERLASCILAHAEDMVRQGRRATLRSWIDALPSSLVRQNGWLCFWQGICLQFSDLPASREFLQRAFALFEKAHETTGIFRTWSAIVDSYTYAWDDLAPLDRWIRWLDDNDLSSWPARSLEIEAAVVHSMVSALAMRQPQHPRIAGWLEHAERLVHRELNPLLKLQIGTMLSLYHFSVGNFGRAGRITEIVRQIAASPDASPLAFITWKWFEAGASTFYDVAPERGLEAVREGLEFAQRTGVHMLDFMLFVQGLCTSLSAGQLESADAYVRRISAVALGKNARSAYHYYAAWYAYFAGDAARAFTHIEQAVDDAVASGMPFAEGLVRTAFAELLFDRGQYRQATEQLVMVRAIAANTGSRYFVYTTNLAEARFLIERSSNPAKDARCRDMLEAAMRIGREYGLTHLHWWVPAWMLKLCLTALEWNIEVPYVQQLIRKRRLMPEAAPYGCEQWPWEIKIRTLGCFDIARNGKPLEFPVKAPRKILLLLKALIACGARGASEEQLADLLWPEADGDTARQTLATSLHRLRQLLGNDQAVQLREGHITLDSLVCWVDAHAFEALLAQRNGRTRRRGKLGDGEVEDVEKAVALYQGPFLGNASEAWAVSSRERLRMKFLRAVEQVGEHAERARRFDEAIAIYESALEHDDLAEQFYRGIMRCCRATGRKAEAIAVYEHCRRILESGMNVRPSPETEAIFRSLRMRRGKVRSGANS